MTGQDNPTVQWSGFASAMVTATLTFSLYRAAMALAGGFAASGPSLIDRVVQLAGIFVPFALLFLYVASVVAAGPYLVAVTVSRRLSIRSFSYWLSAWISIAVLWAAVLTLILPRDDDSGVEAPYVAAAWHLFSQLILPSVLAGLVTWRVERSPSDQ